MTGQLVGTRCAGSTAFAELPRPRRMSHVLFAGPDGPTGWLIRLQPRTLVDRLHPARMRDRLAAVDPVDYAGGLNDLASGTPETLLRLGFTVTRTE